ncbi:hypothetical protein KFE25_006403 [Diacronema lutheri]|uniref:F-box domain-containing protein n=2 Tax=Diacronema lutheri TaxID=2081491 RepID=A0A8J5XQR6_DIALT|nr:hypothetical protein KFE25_006403 [Diacronema lutheri]
MAAKLLLDLPADLLVQVLVHLCDEDRCAGAIDLACVARTCRAVGCRRDGKPSVAEEAARAVLYSPRCVELRAEASGGAPAGTAVAAEEPTARGGWMRALHVFDCGLWRVLPTVELSSLNLGCCAVSPGAAVVRGAPHLVSAGPSGLMLWAVNAPRLSLSFLPGAGAVDVLAIVCTRGLVATACADAGGLVRIHDLADGGRVCRAVQTLCGAISALAACGGVVIAAGEDTLVACFDAFSGELLSPPLLSHAPGQASIASCGSLVAVACAGRMHIFEQGESGERPQLVQVLRGDDAPSASAIALLPIGILAVADCYGEVHVFSRAARAGAGAFALGERWQPRLSFDALPDSADVDCCGLSLASCAGRFLATGHRWGSSVSLWNCFDGELVARLDAPDGVLCLASVQSMLFAFGSDGSVAVWRARNWRAAPRAHCAADGQGVPAADGARALRA